jgi:hypothetical protein
MIALDRDRVASRNASRGGGGSHTWTDERQRDYGAAAQHRYDGSAHQRKTKGTELQGLN